MKKTISLTPALLLLSACGMFKMPDMMQQTVDGMAETNKKIEITNTNMGKTVDGLHNQTLMLSLADMYKEENTLYLFPPIGMMPGGEIFGKEATAEELARFTYAKLKRINSSQADGTGPNPDGSWPAKEALDRNKQIDLTALQVIAGMAPEEKVSAMIEEQITQGGRFETTVYEFLMLRYAFIDGILIQESLFSKTMENPGMFEEGLKYLNQMERIAKLNFRDRIQLKIIGMSIPDNNLELTLDPKAVKNRYLQMKAKLGEISERYSATGNTKVKSRISTIEAAINRGLIEN